MARRSPSRIQMVTSTTGNGPYTLANPSSPIAGRRTIAEAVADGSLVNGDQVLFHIVDTAAAGSGKMMETGLGTINTSTLVLTVVSVYEKSAALTSGGGWGAGTRDVLISPPGAWNTAFIDIANLFTENQSITKTDPAFDLQQGGVTRSRWIYQSNVAYLQYYSSGFALQGQIAMGNGTLDHSNGSVSRRIVLLAGSNVNKLPWYQAAVPLGWVQDTSQNDKAMRIVSGTGGGSGGSRALSSAVVGGTAISVSQMPGHDHTIPITNLTVTSGEGTSVSYLSGGGTISTSASGAGATHDHALALAYIDMIIGSLS